MTPRATTSSSVWHRRLRCLGSEEAEEALPETTSAPAEEGVDLHAAYGLAPLFTPMPATTDLEPDQRDLVLTARRHSEEVIQRTLVAYAVDPGEPFEEGFERELWLRRGLKKLMPGHCDYWRYYPGVKLLIIIDAKFGFVLVDPAPANHQLRCYACMAAQEWDVDDCVVAITQPRAVFHDEGEPLSIASMDRALIAAATGIMLDDLAAIVPGAPRTPSEDACRYCKARLLCRERLARLPDGVTKAVLPSLAAMPDEEFERYYSAVMSIDETIVKTFKGEMRHRILEGRAANYRLKPGSPRRSIEDGGRAFRTLLAAGLPLPNAEECVKIGTGDVEKTLRKLYDYTAKEAKAKANAILRDCITLSTPEPSIVPVNHEKEAAKQI